MSTATETAWLAAEAEAYAAERTPGPPPVHLDALGETYDALSQAALAISNRQPFSAEAHLEAARLAAALAHPAGSERSLALFADIAAMEAEASAAGLLEAAS